MVVTVLIVKDETSAIRTLRLQLTSTAIYALIQTPAPIFIQMQPELNAQKERRHYP